MKCISQGKVGSESRSLCAITNQLIKAGWRKCNALETPSAKESEMVLLFQLGGAVQKCRGHVLSLRRVSGHCVPAGHGVSLPFPEALAVTLLCWVLILRLRSAMPLLVTPILTPPSLGSRGPQNFQPSKAFSKKKKFKIKFSYIRWKEKVTTYITYSRLRSLFSLSHPLSVQP